MTPVIVDAFVRNVHEPELMLDSCSDSCGQFTM